MVPRASMSFAEWRGSCKTSSGPKALSGAARRTRAENPVADSEQQQRRPPLSAGRFRGHGEDVRVLADPDGEGDEYTHQRLARDEPRGEQHAVLRKFLNIA